MNNLFAIVLAIAGASAAGAQENARDLRRADLGKTVKFTCVVDKVMQAHKGWVVEEWMIREAAEAGFNIYSPRIGYDDLDAVARVTAWCDQYGIFHLPWMRGTLAVALDDPAAEGKRVVWADGSEQPLWSPNADELWAWMARYIVAYAAMGAKNEHLLGVFLDYENYAPGRHGGNLYALSYDRDILDRFAAVEGIAIPKLAPSEREPWLEARQLHARFEAFQIAEWRRRCRELRAAVDAHDPAFQFWLYPVPGTLFLQEAAYHELGTPNAPMVVADQTTYGRPSEFMPEAAAVAANRATLEKYMVIPRESGVSFRYAGGIDPVVRGADPEFCGKNAVAISEVTDGYWIFYEGPGYDGEHADYWKWFTWANRAIAAGRFAAQHEARQTPEGFVAALTDQIGTTGFADPAAIGTPVDFPIIKLRGGNMALLACAEGIEATIDLRDIPLGSYTDPLHWELRAPDFTLIESGDIGHDAAGQVRFTPEAGGVYFLGLSAGACTYAITRANLPVALYAGKGMGTVHGAERLYFQVPADAANLMVKIQGSGGETVRVDVLEPDGSPAATAQTTLETTRVALPVDTGAKAGAIWSLSLLKADEGTLEDARVQLEGVPPLLALDPRHVFRPAGG